MGPSTASQGPLFRRAYIPHFCENARSQRINNKTDNVKDTTADPSEGPHASRLVFLNQKKTTKYLQPRILPSSALTTPPGDEDDASHIVNFSDHPTHQPHQE